jgi:hypothetical protein
VVTALLEQVTSTANLEFAQGEVPKVSSFEVKVQDAFPTQAAETIEETSFEQEGRACNELQ